MVLKLPTKEGGKNEKKMMKVLLATCMSFMLLPAVVLAAEEVAINETNFPDAIFRSYVSDKFDTDANGTLSTSEINSAISVNVSGQGITDLRLSEAWHKGRCKAVY